jgi:hypothetical protein
MEGYCVACERILYFKYVSEELQAVANADQN